MFHYIKERIEDLHPLIDDNTSPNDEKAIEFSMVGEIVIAYEEEHYPIGKPTVAELIELSIEEKGLTQKQLAGQIGISQSRMSDYLSGRAEPTLKIARALCQALNIPPAAMLGF